MVVAHELKAHLFFYYAYLAPLLGELLGVGGKENIDLGEVAAGEVDP